MGKLDYEVKKTDLILTKKKEKYIIILMNFLTVEKKIIMKRI